MAKRKTTEEINKLLLDAVEALMRKHGLAGVTTRNISRIAHVAEGTIYNHFRDKSALLVAVLERSAPATMREAMTDLPLRLGQRSVRQNLEIVAVAILAFHRRVAPVICALLADASLTIAGRRALKERGIGPNLSSERLAAYLAAEQRLGRVALGLNVQAAVELLLGASFKIAVADYLFGNPSGAARDRTLIKNLVGAFSSGLEPRRDRQA